MCRNSYIDPRVFEHFYDGETIAVDLEALADDHRVPADELKDAESAVVDLLSHDPAR